MSVDSVGRRVSRGGGLVVRPQAISDKSYVESVVSFLHDVVPQAVTGGQKQEDKERVLWVKFEEADINDSTLHQEEISSGVALPLVLILGYINGFHVWTIPSTGEAQEVLSLRQGPVRLVRLLKTPLEAAKSKDEHADARPLFAVCDAASPSLPFSTVNLWSLSTGEQVHSIAFKSEVYDVLCNRRLMVIALQEKIAAFDACTFKSCFCITSCYPGPSPNLNPLALGTRWLAYADCKLVPNHQSCGGVCGDNSQSYTATVINAAKTLTRGLTMFGETVGRWTGTEVTHDYSTQKKSVIRPGVVTIIDTLKIGNGEFCVQEDDHEGSGIVAHFPAHAGQPLSCMSFDPSGSLLLTADVLGNDFHVYHVLPHPICPSLSAVHHLYTLHRGDTTATVHGMSFSFDSRWVAVSTVRGTVHVFPITPYGGSITVRTHSSRRVVNRSSRFHTSAGLDDLDQATTSSGRHSPCNGTGPNPSCSPNGSPHNSTAAPVARESLTFASTSNNGLANPRLPPLPHSYLVHPFAQIRTPDGPRCGGPCCTGSAQHSNKCNGRVGLEYSMGAAMTFAPSRGWLGGSPNTARAEPLRSSAVDSLFVLDLHGSLTEYVLEPQGVKTVPQSDDTPLELITTARAQWTLTRCTAWPESKSPVIKDLSLLLGRPKATPSELAKRTEKQGKKIGMDSESLITYTPKEEPHVDGSNSDDQWLANIDMETHAAPHRRLWMGPQFSFKTYQPPGSSSASSTNSLGDFKSGGSGSGATIAAHSRDGHPMDFYSEELDLQSLRLQPVRSDPVPTPSGRFAFTGCASPNLGGSMPLIVDNGPGSLTDPWPGMNNEMFEDKEEQLVETLADAMNDNATLPVKNGKKRTTSINGENQFQFKSDCLVGGVNAFASYSPAETSPLFPPDWS